ncbi:MAG: helix-turn-helix domain-containing protein [Bacteroidales bacterium]|nr:helix-turn-helix domain-containing protein [Bacteroidales bacterium]
MASSSPENDVLLTVAEACEIVKLSKPFLYDMINSGELSCLEIGKRKQKRIWRSDLEKIGTRRGNTE